MKDYLIRGTALGGRVRAFGVRTTALMEELRQRHGLSPTASAALGRTISIGAMMGAMLKGEERLTIQVKGDGPIGQIVVDANAKGEVRGYVDHPDADPPLNARGKLNVREAVGEGYIYVIKDLGMREPYRGSTPIVSGEIGEDFTYYFAKSEQTPSAVAVGVLVAPDRSLLASGGIIIQVLPGLTEEEVNELESRLAGLTPVSTLLEQGESLEAILSHVVGEVQVLERTDVVFRCKCSRERVEQTLISLGRQELQSIVREDRQAEVVCHFCNERYSFQEDQLQELIEKIEAPTRD